MQVEAPALHVFLKIIQVGVMVNVFKLGYPFVMFTQQFSEGCFTCADISGNRYMLGFLCFCHGHRYNLQLIVPLKIYNSPYSSILNRKIISNILSPLPALLYPLWQRHFFLPWQPLFPSLRAGICCRSVWHRPFGVLVL